MFGPFAEYENADENQFRHLSWFIFWILNWMWNPVTFMFGAFAEYENADEKQFRQLSWCIF